MIEFGDSPDRREAFISLLELNNITHHIETDHIGRVWIVPDQSKRNEFKDVLKVWGEMREEKIRKLND